MAEPSPDTQPSEKPSDRLDSWKEIAAYLGRDVTTVQRWEKRERMPVHRHLHDKRGSVYAIGSRAGCMVAWPQGSFDRRQGRQWGQSKSQRLRSIRTTAANRIAARLGRRWLAFAVVGVLGLLAAAYVMSRGRTGNPAQPKIGSLAVLPLKNLSGDHKPRNTWLTE